MALDPPPNEPCTPPLYRHRPSRLDENHAFHLKFLLGNGSKPGTPTSPPPTRESTKGPMWGYPRPVLGAVDPLLEPFRGRLSPNIDNVFEKLTLRYPHEGPWVVEQAVRVGVEFAHEI